MTSSARAGLTGCPRDGGGNPGHDVRVGECVTQGFGAVGGDLLRTSWNPGVVFHRQEIGRIHFRFGGVGNLRKCPSL